MGEVGGRLLPLAAVSPGTGGRAGRRALHGEVRKCLMRTLPQPSPNELPPTPAGPAAASHSVWRVMFDFGGA